MNTLRDIAEKLYNANNILLYPHVGTDGDAVGSCVAIAKALRTMGKTAYALYEEEIPGNLSFMLNDPEGKPYFTSVSGQVQGGEDHALRGPSWHIHNHRRGWDYSRYR